MKILKVTNKKTGQVQQSDFKTMNELEAHFVKHQKHWGDESEYTKEILDTDAEEEAERTRKEAKHADRLSRIDQLKAIDWTLVTSFADLKPIARMLVKEAIKDEE